MKRQEFRVLRCTPAAHKEEGNGRNSGHFHQIRLTGNEFLHTSGPGITADISGIQDGRIPYFRMTAPDPKHLLRVGRRIHGRTAVLRPLLIIKPARSLKHPSGTKQCIRIADCFPGFHRQISRIPRPHPDEIYFPYRLTSGPAASVRRNRSFLLRIFPDLSHCF